METKNPAAEQSPDMSPRAEFGLLTIDTDSAEEVVFLLQDAERDPLTLRCHKDSVATQLTDIIEQYSPAFVHDKTLDRQGISVTAVEYLFPILASGGTYTIDTSPELPSSKIDDLCMLAQALVAQEEPANTDLVLPGSLAVLQEALTEVVVTDSAVVLTKSARPFTILTEISLADAPGSELFTSPPVSYPLIVPTYMNDYEQPCRLEGFTKGYSPTTTPTVYARILDDAVVHGGGVVSLAGRYVVSESLIYLVNRYVREFMYRIGESTTYFVRLDFQTAAPSAEQLHVLVRQAWDRNYGHWLVDAFGRMAFLKKVLPAKSKPMYVINNPSEDQLKSLYRDTLRLFGVPAKQVVVASSPPIRYHQLLYISPATAGPLNHHPAIIEMLDSFGRHPRRPKERIYVSRGRYSRRRVTNEEELLPILEKYKFTVVYPEEMTLKEQVKVFAKSSVVAGPFGAALTNLAFSPPGVSVVCLTADSSWAGYFYDIVCHKHGSYFNIYPETTEKLTNASDIWIDPELFEKALQLAIEATKK